jgi:small subunit ribosomal protein S20
MANSAQARKRARQALTRRARNFALRTEFRTAIKKLLKLIASGDKPAAQAEFVNTQSTLDRIARKGIFHKNKAARHKSRLSARIKAMA